MYSVVGKILDLGQNLSSSFDYSKKLFADLGRLLILIVLDVIPIVNLAVVGYMTKVIKEPPTSDELPPLKEYISLWVQGLKVTVAVILYLIVPIIFIAPFVFMTVLPSLAVQPLPIVSWVLVIPMLIVGVLLIFFILIIMSMAIVNMVKKDSFTKAFAIGEVVTLIGNVGWGTYLFWTIIIFVLGVIVGGIGSIPAIGWLISLVIGPIFGVLVSRSASLVYAEGTAPTAHRPTAEEPPTPAATAAPTRPAPLSEEKKFCIYCGGEIDKEAVYCQRCGKKQEA